MITWQVSTAFMLMVVDILVANHKLTLRTYVTLDDWQILQKDRMPLRNSGRNEICALHLRQASFKAGPLYPQEHST